MLGQYARYGVIVGLIGMVLFAVTVEEALITSKNKRPMLKLKDICDFNGADCLLYGVCAWFPTMWQTQFGLYSGCQSW